MERTEWTDLEEFLGKDIGELREMLAYEDAYKTVEDFLVENGWLIRNEEDDDYDLEPEEEEEDWEEEDIEDDAIELPSDQEALAQTIASDISVGKYAITALSGVYSDDFIARVEQLID